MDEILELQQQLAAAQQGTSAQKLSERNCVELVMKLQALSLVDLIFTRSGKEYLTHKQLVIEIEDELLARGGRVNVIDLPESLNVDLVHIQSKIPEVIAASDGSTRLVRGELLTDYYLASVAEEINDSLTSSEHGTDDIGSIASRYGLPVDVARETVKTHLESLINAILDDQNPDLLRSEASIARNRVAARGLLRAVTAPTVLGDLAKSPGRQLPLPLIAEVAEKMLQNGELSGTVVGRGTRAIFVPSVFATAAVDAASSAFASNGFIALNRLERMHIPDANVFAKEHLADALVLNQCIVGPSLIDTLATSAAEAVSGNGWLDVEVALPPDFPEGDIGSVMESLELSLQKENGAQQPEAKSEPTKSSRSRRRARSNADGGVQVEDTKITQLVYGNRFIVSPGLREQFNQRICADAKQKADERARVMSEEMSTVVSHTEPIESQAKQNNVPGKKSKGKGRRRGGAKEKSSKQDVTTASNGTSTLPGPPVAVPSTGDAIEIILSEEALSSALETDYLGSSSAGDDLLSCLIDAMYGDNGLDSLYNRLAEEALVTFMRERAATKMNREKELLTCLEDAELYWKSAESLPEEELSNASRSWVVDEICVNALCRVVDSVAQGIGIIEASIVHAHGLGSKREKLDVVRTVLPKLAPPLETKVRALLSTISDKEGGTVDSFLELYDANMEVLDLPVRRPLDKNAEKNAHANARASMTLALDEESQTKAKCLERVTVLVHAKSCGGLIVAIPPENAVGFCKAIEQNARPEEVGAALRKLREAVESGGDSEDSGEVSGSGLPTSVAEKLAALREYIG